MSQLRATLLIVGVLFIAVLIWWERRRPRQASADGAERVGVRDPEPQGAGVRVTREPSLALPEMRARDPLVGRELPVVEVARDLPAVPVLSPFEPPHEIPREDLDEEEPADFVADATANTAASPAESTTATPAMDPDVAAPEPGGEMAGAAPPPQQLQAVREEIPRLPAGPSPVVDWPPDPERQIVSLRLVAATPERFVGRSLRQALAAEGFVLGRFAIFHKPDDEQRAVLSAASLTRPGTFDADTMDSQHFGGLSLFAVLPGPRPASQAFEELISTARNLNDRLHGVLQDERGSPLTSARIALLRERIGNGSPA
jgi:cell division protein ZipA